MRKKLGFKVTKKKNKVTNESCKGKSNRTQVSHKDRKWNLNHFNKKERKTETWKIQKYSVFLTDEFKQKNMMFKQTRPSCLHSILDRRDAGIRQKQSNREHPSTLRSTSLFCVNPRVAKVRGGSSGNQPLNRQESEPWSGSEISEWLFCQLCWAVDVRLALWHHYLSIWHEMCHIIHGDGVDGESHSAGWEETCKQNNRWVFIQALW